MKRRKFMENAATAAGAFTIIPSFVLGKNHIAPSDRLYLAAFGVGGRGDSVLRSLEKVENVRIISLCDVDDNNTSSALLRNPKAKTFRDYREVYDKMRRKIDAVVVCTPDHMHAPIALPFMLEKKHAYIEKPLSHNIHEARLMSRVAKERKLVTQMGDQGSSGEGIRRTQELINAGIIGKVYKVDCWTNRPVWPQGMQHPLEKQSIPSYLDWEGWLGKAEYRDYNAEYLPFKWRGWWDFGTGALGDMGCHIMATPFKALDLGYPISAEASCTTSWVGDFKEGTYDKTCPASSVVHLRFESKKHGEIQLNWYDGGILPEYPKELEVGIMLGNQDGGTIFYGEKGILVADTYSKNPRVVYPKNTIFEDIPKTLDRVPDDMDGHQRNWVEGCIKGIATSSPFHEYAGPLTETVLMGNLAIRSFQKKVLSPGKKDSDWLPYDYPGRQKLLWNGEAMEITNYKEANLWVKGGYRKGWELPKTNN